MSHSNRYAAVHMRLRAQRGRAADFTCKCGAPAVEWAYQGEGECSDDLSLYEPSCCRCHRLADGNFQRDKTHCKYGHPFNAANTSTNRLGFRRCLVCHRITEGERYHARVHPSV